MGVLYGAQAERAFDAHGGLWIEPALATPFSMAEAQQQLISLFVMNDSAVFFAWDRIHGELPEIVGCTFRFGGAAGLLFGDSLMQHVAPSTGDLAQPKAPLQGRDAAIAVRRTDSIVRPPTIDRWGCAARG